MFFFSKRHANKNSNKTEIEIGFIKNEDRNIENRKRRQQHGTENEDSTTLQKTNTATRKTKKKYTATRKQKMNTAARKQKTNTATWKLKMKTTITRQQT